MPTQNAIYNIKKNKYSRNKNDVYTILYIDIKNAFDSIFP